jgi:hypothetical protein
MHIPVRNEGFYRYWCWLSIMLGGCLAVGGIVLIVWATGSEGERQQLMFAVGGTILIVGCLRIFNCVQILRRMRRPRMRLGDDLSNSGNRVK